MGPHGDEGFTLVELVIAITLAVIVLWAAHSVIQTGLTADARGSEAFDRTQTLRVLADRFTADIEGAFNETAYPDSVFAGDATSLRMCTLRPQAPGGGGNTSAVAVEYSYDADTGTLHRVERNLFDASAVEPDRLGDGPQGQPFAVEVGFSYLSGTEWVDGWDGETPPDAVRMTAAAPSGLGKGRDCIVLAVPAVR